MFGFWGKVAVIFTQQLTVSLVVSRARLCLLSILFSLSRLT